MIIGGHRIRRNGVSLPFGTSLTQNKLTRKLKGCLNPFLQLTSLLLTNVLKMDCQNKPKKMKRSFLGVQNTLSENSNISIMKSYELAKINENSGRSFESNDSKEKREGKCL